LGVRAALTGVSHHLKILRQAGLVSARREGRRAIYVTTDDPPSSYRFGASCSCAQRGDTTLVGLAEDTGPFRLGQHVLDHQRVDEPVGEIPSGLRARRD
jgi:DNA-binding transcriptional ArsR family regulator